MDYSKLCKILKEMGIPDHLTWETCMQVKMYQLELDIEQSGSNLGKEYIKAIYCHPACLTYGNPLQCSCLENPRDGGVWWAAICGVTQSRTWLKWQQQSTSREMPGWMKHKLDSRFLREISIPQICRWHHLNGIKWRGTKESFEVERGEWKSWLKTQHLKNEDHGISGPTASW